MTGVTTVHASAPRPLYFMVALWGEKYRLAFVERCLCSLLAEGNLPLLRTSDGHRLLIATTADDWQAMESSPVMARVRTFVTPVFVEVGYPAGQAAQPGSDAVIRHHAKCLRLLCETAFRDSAYGSVVFPDTIYSTGAVAALLDYAAAGHRLVLCSALRQTEEDVMAELTNAGHLPETNNETGSTAPLRITQREMADLAVRHLHPEVAIYDWDSHDAPPLCAHRFWRVPFRSGLIIRTFYGVPVLMDYAAIKSHNTECLNEDIFENVYVKSNFAKCGGLHVVQDSDEFMLLSLTEGHIGHHHVPAKVQSPWLRDLLRKCGLRASMNHFVGRPRDALKAALFNSPIRWHADDLDTVWAAREREISATLCAWIGDYGTVQQPSGIRFPSRWTPWPRRIAGNLYLAYVQSPRAHLYMHYLTVIADALRRRNNAAARLWAAIRRRLSLSGS
jgi:hypothetical protein